jgi:hypothetical protein
VHDVDRDVRDVGRRNFVVDLFHPHLGNDRH